MRTKLIYSHRSFSLFQLSIWKNKEIERERKRKKKWFICCHSQITLTRWNAICAAAWAKHFIYPYTHKAYRVSPEETDRKAIAYKLKLAWIISLHVSNHNNTNKKIYHLFISSFIIIKTNSIWPIICFSFKSGKWKFSHIKKKAITIVSDSSFENRKKIWKFVSVAFFSAYLISHWKNELI